MKLRLILLLLYLTVFLQCNPDSEPTLRGEFEFIKEYTTMITVGGVVGIADRTFRIGEIYDGIDKGEETITIKIANHLKLNENCPNSWCYQEYLEVPRKFLKINNK